MNTALKYSELKYSELMDTLSGLIEKAYDRFFDLKGLSGYSSLAIPTLRDYLKGPDALPHFKIKGKILVRKSEYDAWLENKFRVKNDLNNIVDSVMKSLESDN